MTNRIQDKSQKNLPGVNFLIPFNLNFSVSSPLCLQEEFKEALELYNKKSGKKTTTTKIFQKELYKTTEVGGSEELKTEYDGIRRKVSETKDEIKKEMGIQTSHEFSSWARKVMRDFIKGVNRKYAT